MTTFQLFYYDVNWCHFHCFFSCVGFNELLEQIRKILDYDSFKYFSVPPLPLFLSGTSCLCICMYVCVYYTCVYIYMYTYMYVYIGRHKHT